MTVIIALDVGERRIGVAASDPTGLLASPVGAIIRNDLASTLDGIGSVARDRGATAILVGVPLGLLGEATTRSEDIRSLANRIEAHTGLPMVFRDERNTSQDALRLATAGDLAGGHVDALSGGSSTGRRARLRPIPSVREREARRRRIDALAATVLLQAYLDERRRLEEALKDALDDRAGDNETDILGLPDPGIDGKR
ncbi:MAG: Holliday junction resolvase RuvX [Chloroflexi bacterium]|nr:Holliday junction resolvase RuvX [Chloroflexota bacterium]